MAAHHETIDRWFALIDARRFEEAVDLLAPDCDVVVGGQAVGAAGFVAMAQGFFTAFPDLRHHVGRYLEDGDRAGYELRITGTHTGPMRTPQGDLPATGRTMALEAVNSVRFGADGKPVSLRSYFDTMQMLEQLGLAPG